MKKVYMIFLKNIQVTTFEINNCELKSVHNVVWVFSLSFSHSYLILCNWHDKNDTMGEAAFMQLDNVVDMVLNCNYSFQKCHA